MPLEYALETLNKRQLWFSNPTVWKDPFEKLFIEAQYKYDGKLHDFQWKNRVFCFCLTQTPASEAHWNTYVQQGIGIEFRINRKLLLKELEKHAPRVEHIYIGRVEYMKFSDINGDINKIPFKAPVPKSVSPELFARLLLLKRVEFQYENEIRIIIVKKKKAKKEGMSIKYSCKNTDLIHSIYLSPSLERNTTELLKEAFRKKYHFIPFNKQTHRVMKSQLYKPVSGGKICVINANNDILLQNRTNRADTVQV